MQTDLSKKPLKQKNNKCLICCHHSKSWRPYQQIDAFDFAMVILSF